MQHLPPHLGAVVWFLFFCPWRVGAARRLEWRDYSEADQSLTLRPELNKTGHELQIPIDAANTPELMAVMEAQKAQQRIDLPFIFTGGAVRRVTTNRASAVPASGTSKKYGIAPAKPSGTRGASHTTYVAPA